MSTLAGGNRNRLKGLPNYLNPIRPREAPSSAKAGQQNTPVAEPNSETTDKVVGAEKYADPNHNQLEISQTRQSDPIQVLELHGSSPIISYHNQIYSCSWADMIGTDMFFAKSTVAADDQSRSSMGDAQLIGTSRIKIIGQKTRLTKRAGKKCAQTAELNQMQNQGQDDPDEYHPAKADGKSLGDIRTTSALVNVGIKRQAAFLEKMMDVKRLKGESDNVRTVFTSKPQGQKMKDQPAVESRFSATPGEGRPMAEEIEELNKRVVRGDAAALMRLQDIYSAIEGNE